MEWLAIGVGLAGGVLFCIQLGKRLLPPLVERAKQPNLFIKLTFGATVIAALPALLLSIAVGAPLGAPWGALGIVAGVAAVFSVTVLLGTFAGMLLARYLR
jgi:hypothetical protein